LITVPKLTISDAQLGLIACRKKAAEIQVAQDIAIADESGNLLLFERMDGAIIGCIQIAIDKAYTAAVLGIRTEEEGRIAQPGGPEYGINSAAGGRLIIFGGGIPIKYGKSVIGAVGCSSGTVDQDMAVAQAGVDAIEESFRKQNVIK
jgi:uncharacterized protein GlcG (DUF336 family)